MPKKRYRAFVKTLCVTVVCGAFCSTHTLSGTLSDDDCADYAILFHCYFSSYYSVVVLCVSITVPRQGYLAAGWTSLREREHIKIEANDNNHGDEKRDLYYDILNDNEWSVHLCSNSWHHHTLCPYTNCTIDFGVSFPFCCFFFCYSSIHCVRKRVQARTNTRDELSRILWLS